VFREHCQIARIEYDKQLIPQPARCLKKRLHSPTEREGNHGAAQ
jgi:hypothetical protein